MRFPSHISHYFEKEAGPLLNICDLKPVQRSKIIQREMSAPTGFNRFAYGEAFFEFRQLADDLLLEHYKSKFGQKPPRRPFYAVLGDADVVGGLFRDPYKMRIPIDSFRAGELTFMCPDHFHLVSFMKRNSGKKTFGIQLPKDYSASQYPYFGKLMTYDELIAGFEKLKIDQHLEKERKRNGWYRYIEAQIWADPTDLKSRYPDRIEVDPEPWSEYNKMTHLQNHKRLQRNRDFRKMNTNSRVQTHR